MSTNCVSDVFAFVLEHGDFSETILFSEEEIPELKPEERRAVDAVSQHVKYSYVALLLACRDALLVTAATWKNRHILERNKSRPDTIWNRSNIQMPLLIRRSWVAWVTFGLWNTSEPGRPIKLFADVATQRRHFAILADVANEMGGDLRSAECVCRMGRILPKQGDSFSQIASELANVVWPVARTVHDRIVGMPDKDAT